MKHLKATSLAFLLLLMPGIAITGWAQAQRMGIPRGSFSLPPNGSNRVNAFCLDYTRETPPKTPVTAMS